MLLVNKKGFVFIETIVMCAVLMVALLIIYNSYTSAIAREKERINYNIVAGEIRISLVKKYLVDKYPNIWICSSEISCPGISSLFGENDFIGIGEYLPADIANLYNIQQIYVAKCNGDFSWLEGDFGVFVNSMKGCSDTRKYRFVAEFKENNGQYSYAWVEYPYVEEDENEE